MIQQVSQKISLVNGPEAAGVVVRAIVSGDQSRWFGALLVYVSGFVVSTFHAVIGYLTRSLQREKSLATTPDIALAQNNASNQKLP